MDPQLSKLYETFRGIRTECTGIMGYLAMLHEGDFRGSEQSIVADLAKAATHTLHRLDALRDSAAAVPRSLSREVDEAVVVVLTVEPAIRLPLEVLAKRLASTVPGLPASHWTEDLELAQKVVRGLAKMNDSLKAAHSAGLGDHASTESSAA
jgi:hypothetical protein